MIISGGTAKGLGYTYTCIHSPANMPSHPTLAYTVSDINIDQVLLPGPINHGTLKYSIWWQTAMQLIYSRFSNVRVEIVDLGKILNKLFLSSKILVFSSKKMERLSPKLNNSRQWGNKCKESPCSANRFDIKQQQKFKYQIYK